MSSIARWSYKYRATIRPFLAHDSRTGVNSYGPEYVILCSVAAATAEDRGAGGSNGIEFIARHVIYTEDARPKKLDMVQFEGSDGWEEIRDRTMWEMAAFNDTPDYKLIT